jgi:hypothetical protein
MLLSAVSVEEEVFENERYLPFRGWGHQWPGHLLPTDRVGHWSLRGDRPSGAESMEFHQVAPTLREVSPTVLAAQRSPLLNGIADSPSLGLLLSQVCALQCLAGVGVAGGGLAH